MILTDTHSHLYAEQFQEDMETVIERCKEEKVERVFLPNIDIESIEAMKSLWQSDRKMFFPMMGLHPCSVEKTSYKEVLKYMREELDSGDYCAIGETGIDLYWDKTTFPEQEDSFRIQIEWALELDLPIVIHARESTQEIIDILKDYPNTLRGVFHCFSGNEEQAHEVINRGMYIGLGGVLTFKNSNLKDIVKDIDMEHLLLETDSPYLAPTPFRGKRNESSYVIHIAEYLSDIKNIPVEEVAKITTDNSVKLFKV